MQLLLPYGPLRKLNHIYLISFSLSFLICQMGTIMLITRELKNSADMLAQCLACDRRFFFLFSGHAHGIWKFPGQGSNLHHSSDWGHCSDNAGSLNCCATGELLDRHLIAVNHKHFIIT